MTIAVPTSRRVGSGTSAVAAVPRSAVAWINGRHAMVARMTAEGRISTSSIERGLDAEWRYLIKVVHAIGDQERVVILGPSSVRLLLEREYVAIYHRPDHLVDVELGTAADEAMLIDRLRELAGPPVF
jgi:hypothetical protein